jgi:beta-lactamase regulating signal transducer with metallopeptidase domain
MRTLLQSLASDHWSNLVFVLLHTLWLGVVFGLALALVLRLLSPRRPQTRYITALAALIGLVIATLTLYSALDRPGSLGRHRSAPPLPSSTSSVERYPEANSRSILSRPEPLPTAPPQIEGDTKESAKGWIPLISLSWIVGVLIMIGRLVSQLVDLKRVRTGSAPVQNPEWIALMVELKARLFLSRPVRLAFSPRVWTPSVFGFVYPSILLPLSMSTGIPIDQIRAILAHELAHIRRYDYLVNLFQQFVEALLFFNPAVWWINRQIRIEREACCDALAVKASGGNIVYARALADYIEVNHTRYAPLRTAPAFGGDGKPHSILDRLKRLLTPQYQPIIRIPWHSFLLVLLASGAILVSAWRGSQVAVAVAAEWLTPAQRIAKIDTLQATHQEQNYKEYTGKDRIQVSGTVRTEDGSPLPRNTLLSADVRRPGASFGYGGLPLKNGAFSKSFDFGNVYLSVVAPGWAPAFAGPFRTNAGGTINGIEIILKKGFESFIRLVDNENKPLKGISIEAEYQRHGAWTGLPLVTDSSGTARVENAVATPIHLKASVPGFQYSEKEGVILEPGIPFTWKLDAAKPADGKVVDQATGKPVAEAKVKLVNREPLFSRTWSPFSSAPVLATTDTDGRFTLSTLTDGARHVLLVEAKGFAPKLVYKVMSASHDLRISLGPELFVKGKIIGNLSLLTNSGGKIIVSNPFEFEHNSYLNSDPVPVDVRGDAAYFEIGGLREGKVDIQAGSKVVKLDVAHPITNLVINLDEKSAELPFSKREVVIRLKAPLNLPPVKGALKTQALWKDGSSMPISIPVQNGEVHLSVPVPGYLAFEPVGLIGYWIQEENALPIGEGSSPLIIERDTLPAGAIFGEVADSEGQPIDQVLVAVVEVAQAPGKERPSGFSNLGKNSASGGDGPTHYMAQPLPLGGKYMIVAHRGYSFITSPVIDLTEKNPITKIDLRLAKGTDVGGRVTDNSGIPIEGIKVLLDFSTTYGHGFTVGDGVVTDPNGNFRFPGVNLEASGSYSVQIEAQNGFRPARMAVPKNGPITFVLNRGVVLSGVVLNESTGNPLSGVDLYAIPEKLRPNESFEFLNADAKTDSTGHFQFSSLESRNYKVRSRTGEIKNGNRRGDILIQNIQQGELVVEAGKTNSVTIRLQPRSGESIWELGKLVE